MKLYPIEICDHREPPFMGIAIDLANSYPSSICQISLSWVVGTEIKALSWLVKPPTNDFSFVKYHGITEETVKDEPPFYQVWDEHIVPLMNYNIFASHYSQRTMQAIIESYEFMSERVFPANHYIVYDTYLTAKETWGAFPNNQLQNYKLESISRLLKIDLDKANIISRSLAIANILNYCFANYAVLVPSPKVMAYVANKHCFSQWMSGADVDETDGMNGDVTPPFSL